ncbi:hypothetical protein [Rhizobium sp. BT03]|uniref:hypothetical protein n=1 Tax=Rhizobium sp. BT03 TaxID=3045156 RepID=UPI0024B3D288|nr:hypothetical protein [Rhizobium sp. BT03]WHO76262.1 hypothetical protein QMO80_005374 [Rhizobium sp. BT03]
MLKELSAIALTFGGFFGGLQNAAQAQSAGPYHPRCVEAFNDLPLDENDDFIETDVNGETRLTRSLEIHFSKHRKEYLSYDADCFSPWEDLRQPTKDFISGSLGTLFTDDTATPFCAAFRISRDILLTAAHCARQAKYSEFRLIGYPDRRIKVVGLLDEAPSSDDISDFDDYVRLKIRDPKLPGHWDAKDFSRDAAPHQAVIVIALSIVARQLIVGSSIDNWRQAVRFSRANSAQLWPAGEVDTGLPKGADIRECLYHRAPTFPGMSGAPIIAIHRPASPTSPPTFTVIGIHLRNGVARSNGCGSPPDFNVGIKLPASITRVSQ